MISITNALILSTCTHAPSFRVCIKYAYNINSLILMQNYSLIKLYIVVQNLAQTALPAIK
jgi:hypothetical protein